MIVLPPTALTRMSTPPNSLLDRGDRCIDLSCVERIAEPAVRRAAGAAQCRDASVEPVPVIVDADDDRRLRAP